MKALKSDGIAAKLSNPGIINISIESNAFNMKSIIAYNEEKRRGDVVYISRGDIRHYRRPESQGENYRQSNRI